MSDAKCPSRELSKHERDWLVEFAGMNEKTLAEWDCESQYPAAWDPWYAAVQTVRAELGADSGGDGDIPTPGGAVREILTVLSNALYDGGIIDQSVYSVSVPGLMAIAKRLLELERGLDQIKELLAGRAVESQR